MLVVSPLLVDELATVIGREKFRPFLSVKDGQQLTWALAHDATVVDDPPDVTPLSRDRRDDYLVALARAADAQVLVTGDADLLELGLLDLSIVTPRAFLELLPE